MFELLHMFELLDVCAARSLEGALSQQTATRSMPHCPTAKLGDW